MLHDLETLIGSSVFATDGEIGSVRNFLFDDRSWKIRYLVVEVGRWLDRREVVLAVASVEPPDWEKRSFHVKCTKEQVRNSPDVNTEKPVTLQQEIAMLEYYDVLAYWLDSGFAIETSMPAGTDYGVSPREDRDLRSALDLRGYEVWATDGEIGRLDGLIMDEASWYLGYMSVKAGGWLHSRSVLIPTRRVKSVSWANRRVSLQEAKEGT
jgi:uncharacterized protein YrrD